jgi:site-specific DNA recombinase
MQVALYARVSTTRQADNDLSIPDQLRQLREWAKSNGHIVVAEFIEPGASATDDKRPVFQQMISEALQKPQTFDAIIIHSLSRFFRDAIQFGLYERKLSKNKVKVISITQQTSDDSAGEMMRRIISTFDEYQSKENSKHTSRAMRENARQGYFNGSKSPFGYTSISTEVTGARGRSKKKLEINEAEAHIVRTIYDLYLFGIQGRMVGQKEIGRHMTENGMLMRGKPWRVQKVHSVLSDTLYMGDYYFNVIDSKTGQKRDPSEWVKTEIPAIIDSLKFEQVRLKRESRAPDKVSPAILSSPTLMTGIIKCGQCGGSMTLATGKGGRYKYYKCTSRKNKGNHVCTSSNLPMEKTDQQVLRQLADKVFAPERVQTMMTALRKRISAAKDNMQHHINELNRQLKSAEERQHRLLDAIEMGVVNLDETVKSRAQNLQAAREALVIQIATVRKDNSQPLEHIKASQVEKFSQLLKEKLLAKDSAIAKTYLNLLVDTVVVNEDVATITGSYDALASAVGLNDKKNGHLKQVPTSISDWGG